MGVVIPKFPGNKKVAVTFSFDDGVETDRRTIEKFNEWGLKATWNLNSGFLGTFHDWGGCPYVKAGDVAEIYRGHEVAIHTVSHPKLSLLDKAQVAREVLDDRRALEDLVGYAVRGMAYPHGKFSDSTVEALRGLDIVYARTIEVEWDCFPPRDPLKWATTAHFYHENALQSFQEKHQNTWDSNYAMCFWGHTYEFKQKDDWGALERIFKPMAGLADVWYCTNIQLFEYEDARKRMVIAANSKFAYNPSGVTVTVLVDGKKMVEVPPGATVSLV